MEKEKGENKEERKSIEKEKIKGKGENIEVNVKEERGK